MKRSTSLEIGNVSETVTVTASRGATHHECRRAIFFHAHVHEGAQVVSCNNSSRPFFR